MKKSRVATRTRHPKPAQAPARAQPSSPTSRSQTTPQAGSASETLTSLAQGIHPLTGAELPPESVCNEARVIRALLAGAQALEEQAARKARRAHLGPNVGKSWTPEALAQLAEDFRQGVSLTDIASRLGRSSRAIELRLVRLGLMINEERTTGDTFNPIS